jgi:hypothetical protein
MATKKKDSSGNPRSKSATGGGASALDSQDHEVWERLQELASAFHQAADRERSEELLNVGFVLRTLSEKAEFRKLANREARKQYLEATGPKSFREFHKDTITSRAQQLLYWMAPAIDEYREKPRDVAQILLIELPRHRQLVYCIPEAPTATDSHDMFVAAVERVAEAIRPKLADPDKDAKDVVRAALRALGADRTWVNNVFQNA